MPCATGCSSGWNDAAPRCLHSHREAGLVKTTPVRPARLERGSDGALLAPDFGDIYHSRSGALEQARHVFLAGNGLPARWRGRERFVILETGFGLGNNFLAAWSAWRGDAERCARLHFVSIESRPLTAADLEALPRDPALVPLARQLAAAWPPLTCNLHRLSFEAGRVQLLLAFGDVAAWLPQIEASVDAFFLDGFAPAKNPQMWEPRLFKAMARIAAPQASAATWSAARPVREGLRAAGFAWTRASGTGGKRDITVAQFAPSFAPRPSPRRSALVRPGHVGPVVIVGAGLAGCATAWALAEQGLSSLLLERGTAIASEGSGNAAGLFHGVVHRDDGRHARFNRAAALEAARQVGIAIADHGIVGSVAGLLRLDPGGDGAALMQATIDRHGLPADYVRALAPDEGSALAGMALSAPAWFYPRGGWVDPRGLAQSFLDRAAASVGVRRGAEVSALRRHADGRWLLLDAQGSELASSATVVLANAGGAPALLGTTVWPIERQRGQISAVRAALWPAADRLRLPIAGSGYLLPPLGDRLWFGATSQADDGEVSLRAEDHRDNLARLQRLITEVPAFDLDALEGRVACRYAALDRLPLIGAVPLSALGPPLGRSFAAAASARPEQPRFAQRAPGLFVLSALGSRGIAWSALGAQALAAMIAGAPISVEADLLDAIDPARFESRSFRRSGAAEAAASAGLDQWPEGPMATGSAGS
jgi:tRNA 5-methylaminomethyl-2-thiouridine biosynthesis bifunctional protein